MNTLKKLLWIIIATAVALCLIAWTWNAFGAGSALSALLVVWLVMSWIALVGQVVHLSLAPSYYRIRSFEDAGQVYEHLGIRPFKKLVRRGPLSIFSPTLRFPKDKNLTALLGLEGEMRKAEAGHVIAFLLLLVYGGYLLISGWLGVAIWALVFNILVNGYPIMLQRYNRIKLQALIGEPQTQ